MKNHIQSILIVALLWLLPSTLMAQLEIYPFPASFNSPNQFNNVTIDGQTANPFNLKSRRDAVRFSFDSSVEIIITSNLNLVNVKLYPAAYGIGLTQISGNQWSFNLPANYAKSKLLFTGEDPSVSGRFYDLHIIGNPPVEPVPTTGNVVEYTNGLHEPGDRLTLQGNTTYYLHPGAVLNTTIYAVDVDNITIMGNGIVKGINGVEHPRKPAKEAHTIEMRDVDDITVKGITIADGPGGGGWHTQVYRGEHQAYNLTIDNISTLRTSYQSDGVGIGAYTNVNITNSYIMSGDHPIVMGWKLQLKDVTISDCVLHPALNGHGNIYLQGNNAPNSMENILLKNIYFSDLVVSVVDNNWYDIDYISNIVMEDFYIDAPLDRLSSKNGGGKTRKILTHIQPASSTVDYQLKNWHLPSYPFTGGGDVTSPATVTLENSDIDGVPITQASQLDWEWLDTDGRLTIISGPPDIDAPTVPVGLAESNVSAAGFEVNWTASADNVGVSSYEVFLDGSSQGTTANTHYSITGLQPNTTYTVTVSASDAAGNSSAQSAGHDITTTNANCTDIIGYDALQSNGANTPDKTQDGLYSSKWNYQIPSGQSNWIEYEFACQVHLDAVNIIFTKRNIRTYDFDIEVSTDGINFTAVNAGTLTSSILSLPANDNVLTSDYEVFILSGSPVAKFVRIKGYGNSEGSGWFNISELTLDVNAAGSDTEAPSVPSGLASSNVTETSFEVNWVASTDNVGVSSYEVFLDGTSLGTTTNTNYAITGLQASTTYTVTVSASDAAGNTSALSAGYDVTTASNDCTTIVDTDAQNSATGKLPDHTLDGLYSTNWTYQIPSGQSNWIEYEFACETTVEAVNIVFKKSHNRTYDFDIQVSTDGVNFTTVESGLTSTIASSEPTDPLQASDYEVFTLTNPATATHVRVVGYGNSTGNGWFNITSLSFTHPAANARIAIQEDVSLDLNNSSSAIHMYPNPVTDFLTIEVSDENPVRVSIFNMQGKEVLSKDINGKGKIETANLTNGIYLIKIPSANGYLNQKFLKQ